MKRRAALVAALCLACATRMAAGVPDTAFQAPPSRDWFLELDAWLDAADRHEPGKADAAAAAIAPWTHDRLARVLGDVLELRKRMSAYRDRPRAEIRLRLRRLLPGDVCQLFRIGDEERLAADLTRVIERGAVLHADIAVFASDLPATPGDGGITLRLADASQLSVNPGTSHWQFGRDLVAALSPGEPGERFAAAWYGATAAFLQFERLVNRADEHLAVARRLLPREPGILHAGACALETLASRKVQTEMSALSPPPGFELPVRPARELEDAAAALFAGALAREPGNTEARIRMARLLGLRGEHERAVSELQAALAVPQIEHALRYFAWLFLGDEQLALGSRPAAADAYERAASLFPRASSPLVALARLAREFGDRDALSVALRRWWALPVPAEDPWRDYYFMQGADYEARMQQVYRLAGRRAR